MRTDAMTNNCWELKRSYQRHLGWGVVLSGTGSILLVLFLLWVSSIFSKPETGRIVMIKALAELGSPIMIVPEDEQGQVSAEEGKPVPTSKPEVVEVRIGTLWTGEVHPGIVYDPSVSGVSGSNQDGWVEIKVPPSDIQVWGLPQCKLVVIPEYPSQAKEDSVEARVWVQIKIAPDGEILEIYARESVAGYGFADVVAGVVEDWEYRPGSIDKAYWTALTMEFKLKT